MCDCNAAEIKNLKGQVRNLELVYHITKAELGLVCYNLVDTKASLAAEEKVSAAAENEHKRALDRCLELSGDLRKTKAELSVVRSDLADTTATLDNYRDMHVNSSRINSVLRKSVSDLEDTIRTLTEERDTAREMFQGMLSKYAELSDRHSKMCDDYDGLVSRYDDLLLRCDDEHGEV